MIELRFHEDLYDGFSVDEAVKVYADFLRAELAQEGRAWVVRVTASPHAIEEGIDEATLAAELSNYALGKTIERSRASDGAAEAGGQAA
ncbi:MAG TPA: HxsD-like protein [Candidatus Nanopelagicales bacterium]|nr:HxsD-like protein [Candidatus Nanopelagicales bacterium]